MQKLSGVYLVFVLLVGLVSSSQTAPTKEDMERLLQGRPGSVNWTEQQKPNGVVEYSLSVTDCSGAECRVVSNKIWRQTKAWVEVDGHYFLAETIDSMDNEGYPVHSDRPMIPSATNKLPKRLKFAAAIAEPSKDKNGFDPATLQSLQLQTDSSMYDVAKDVLPSLAVGVKNGIEDLQRSLATSRKLHEAYLDSLNQTLRLVDLNQKRVESNRENAMMNSAMSATFLGQMHGALASETTGIAGLQRTRDLNEFQRSQQRLFTFKQYELTEEARTQLVEAFFGAAESGQLGKAQRISEVLLNQKDPLLAKQAAEQLRRLMPQGILRVKNIRPQEVSAPLDEFQPRTALGSPSGQVVRRVANKAQSYWVESNGFAANSK